MFLECSLMFNRGSLQWGQIIPKSGVVSPPRWSPRWRRKSKIEWVIAPSVSPRTLSTWPDHWSYSSPLVVDKHRLGGTSPWKWREAKVMNTHYIVNTEELPLQVTRAIRRLLIINPHYIVRKGSFWRSSFLIIWVFLFNNNNTSVFLFDDQVTRETSPASDADAHDQRNFPCKWRERTSSGKTAERMTWQKKKSNLMTQPQDKWYKLAEGFLFDEFLFDNMSVPI